MTLALKLPYLKNCFDWGFIVGFKVDKGGPRVPPTFLIIQIIKLRFLCCLFCPIERDAQIDPLGSFEIGCRCISLHKSVLKYWGVQMWDSRVSGGTNCFGGRYKSWFPTRLYLAFGYLNIKYHEMEIISCKCTATVSRKLTSVSYTPVK